MPLTIGAIEAMYLRDLKAAMKNYDDAVAEAQRLKQFRLSQAARATETEKE